MALLDDITLGRFVPGDSLLHRCDPRLKLAGVPLLIVAVFSARGFPRLVVLAGAALLFMALSQIEVRVWWRGIRVFRWLFLFTLLLHLFFTPGKTLAGVAWLSEDGLWRGILVVSQLVLAVLFSSLLTLTASPQALAAAFSSFLAPLRRFRFPADEATMLFLLVLRFIPILREESAESFARSRAAGIDPSRGSLAERALALRRMTAPLVLRLVDRAEELAHQVAAGENVVGETVVLEPFSRIGRIDLALFLAGVLGLVFVFRIP